jgi:uncharacterized protein YyaL (SSP411 family)
MGDAWRNDREKIGRSSAELTRFLEARTPKLAEAPIDVNVLGLALHQLFKRYDATFGGFGQAPKFPPTQSLAFLLRAHALRPNAAALEAFSTTLSGMARGGFFDQLGGGFHRYSVDAEWKIPHFEKMLYDNALLAPLYLDGYRMTGEPLWRSVAERTLEYIVREMSAPEGGFFSAEDAGEVGKEGAYYSWTPDEVHAVLPAALAERFCALYSVSREGNFEHGRSALMLSSEEAWRESESPEIREARRLLVAAREIRPRPHRDEKILTGWNGLAITALCRGYQVIGRDDFLDAALKAASFIERELVIDGRLHRRYCAGRAGIPALLEDYAYLIEGYRALFESTGDSSWIERAAALQREQDRYLWSGERRAYVSSSAPGLIVQMTEWVDGASPSPNGVSLSNLLVLAEVTGEAAFAYRAQLLEQGVPQEAASIPMVYMATLNSVVQRMAGVASCSVIPPTPADTPPHEVRELWARFLPFATVVWGRSGAKGAKMLESRPALGDKATMYVCRHTECQEPTVDVERAVRLCSTTSITFGE